jgi:hypothetical protein
MSSQSFLAVSTRRSIEEELFLPLNLSEIGEQIFL